MENEAGILRLTYRGNRKKAIGYFIFAGIGLIFSLFSAFVDILGRFQSLDSILFALVFIGVFYRGLVERFNRIILEVRPGALSLKRSPLPWPGKRSIEANRVRNLYLTKTKTKLRGVKVNAFQLNALLEGDRKLVLLEDIDREETARFLEKKIERSMGLIDERIAGAYLPPEESEDRPEELAEIAPLPVDCEVIHENERLIIIAREGKTGAYAFLIGGIIAISTSLGASFMMPLFTIFGIVMLYKGIAQLVNTIRIVVEKNRISVKRKPLPLPGNHVVSLADLKRLVTEKERRKEKGSTRWTYGVYAELKNDTRLKFVSGLETEDDALFIERKIEERLGIAEQRATGE